MDTRTLVEALRDPEAYPRPPDAVEVHHTHISAVFLAGQVAYKVKKPLDLGFLDFTTLERRLHFCREEVRLNRRLAPDVYLGVVPIVRTPSGLRVEGKGPVVEWAVKMVRLPPEATLRERLLRGELGSDTLTALARRLAEFHAGAESGPEISRYGRLEVVAENARENLTQAGARVGEVLSAPVHRRLREALEERLDSLGPTIEDRAARHVPRDTHGDLHLDHVYLFPDRNPPGDLVIIDCIEFGERFRCSDPVSDMAFLAMDLIHHGRRDLEQAFSREYVRASGDREGARLLPFYRSYRAAVRGKVEGMVDADEVGAEQKVAADRSARGHWLLALCELEPPSKRPGLVLVGGLPGTGKSTLAGALAKEAGFRVVASDRIRKSLAGGLDSALRDEGGGESGFEQGIYTPEWTARTYEACLERVRRELFRGERVLVDASFRDDGWRRTFLETGLAHGVPTGFLRCETSPETARERLHSRVGGPSDADWAVHVEARARWEPPSSLSRRHETVLSTEGDPETVTRRALACLEAMGLWTAAGNGDP